MRCKQVWVFESQACLRIWGTHFVTKCSQQEIAGRRHTLNLEPSNLEQTENIQKQNQSHGPPGKTNTPKSYFLNCTPGRVWSGRIWKWEKQKHWPQDLLDSLGGKNMRVFHCGLVPFRLKHFWQIKGYLNLFWLPKEEQTSPTFHTDWSFMRTAGVSGQGEGHPGHQILKELHVGSRKDLGHHIVREHSNSQ